MLRARYAVLMSACHVERLVSGDCTQCRLTAVLKSIGPCEKKSRTAVSGGDSGRTRMYTPRYAYLFAVLATS